jgi:hypothetical protein
MTKQKKYAGIKEWSREPMKEISKRKDTIQKQNTSNRIKRNKIVKRNKGKLLKVKNTMTRNKTEIMK